MEAAVQRIADTWEEGIEADQMRFASVDAEQALQQQAAGLVRMYLQQLAADDEIPLVVETTLEEPLVDPFSGEDLGITLPGIMDLILDDPDSCVHAYDEHRQKVGETWLLREGLEQQRALDELYSADELRKIQRQERTNELELLAENVGLDRQEGELAVKLRRVGILGQMREAVLADEFSQIETDEQLAKMLQQVDRDRLIRQDEWDALKAAYKAKQDDRQAARDHLVRKL